MECPLCKSKNVSNYLKLTDIATAYSCQSCNNAFTYPPPKDFNYKRASHEAQAVFNSIYELPSDWRKSSLLQLKVIKKYLPKNSQVLEIGCGNGIFMTALKAAGYNTTGIEPSITSSTIAKQYGLDVITDTFPSVNLTKKYDLIVASHVIEHIKDINNIFKSIYLQLKPNGLVMLTQTYYKGMVPYLDKASWYAWVPEQHYYHFTPSGITAITSTHGYITKGVWYSTLVQPPLKNLPAYLISKLGDQFHIVLQKKT